MMMNTGIKGKVYPGDVCGPWWLLNLTEKVKMHPKCQNDVQNPCDLRGRIDHLQLVISKKMGPASTG